MAASQRRKRRRKQARREEAFYEAMPIALPTAATLPVTVPDIRDLGSARELIGRIFGVAWAYAAAGFYDVGNLIWSLLRRLMGRRARALYLVLFVGLAGVGVYEAKLQMSALITRYTPLMSSPAVLITNKTTGITLTDRNGTVLYSTAGDGGTKLANMSDLPPNFIHATLAAEDPTFYQHNSISVRGLARAAYVDITSGSTAEGGSTLTQQLVKNALLTSDKTITRKVKELVLSHELESRYSKDQILEMYVSEVPYGQGSYGVQAASETYFHKPASQLDLAQSALLAGLPQATTLLDPTQYPDAAKTRRDYVLERMTSLGMISPAQAKTAKAEPINVSPKMVQILAPHFVFYVLDQLKAQYGDAFLDEGKTVTTTLDLAKQNLAQATVTNQVTNLSANHVTNGGLVSLDPTNGDVLAMVGSVDYNEPNFGAVNITLSELQPGSSFKPFAYVTAFEKGWTGGSVVDDTLTNFPDGTNTYTPLDYDNTFKGPVTLRYALANSLNIPAVKVLQYAGIPATVTTAESLGITTLKAPSAYGLALVLGGGDVRPIDMAAAYGAFATSGHKVTPRSVLKISDKIGTVSYQAPATVPGAAVLDPRYAYMITSILSDNTARTPDFGPNSPLNLTRPDAAKTGTTNDFRDNWTVGYTPNLVTSVWVGNNDHSAMNGVNGITGAAPIWHNYMEGALASMPVENFTQPAGITMVPVSKTGCALPSGSVAATTEAFLSTALPKSCAAAPENNVTPALTPTPAAVPIVTP